MTLPDLSRVSTCFMNFLRWCVIASFSGSTGTELLKTELPLGSKGNASSTSNWEDTTTGGGLFFWVEPWAMISSWDEWPEFRLLSFCWCREEGVGFRLGYRKLYCYSFYSLNFGKGVILEVFYILNWPVRKLSGPAPLSIDPAGLWQLEFSLELIQFLVGIWDWGY